MAEAATKELTITRVFNAPRELVFKAWTDPELVAKWWGPDGVTNPVSEVDARVGGKIHIVMLAGPELGPMAGQRWPMRGEFQELKVGERIVFKNNAVDENDNILIDGVTTVDFEDAPGGKTKMTMHTVATGVGAGSAQMLAGMTHGWTQSIDRLERLLHNQ